MQQVQFNDEETWMMRTQQTCMAIARMSQGSSSNTLRMRRLNWVPLSLRVDPKKLFFLCLSVSVYP